jgi:hypothetical protein
VLIVKRDRRREFTGEKGLETANESSGLQPCVTLSNTTSMYRRAALSVWPVTRSEPRGDAVMSVVRDGDFSFM